MRDWRLPNCKKNGCQEHPYAVGLCSEHYHQFVFKDELEILEEWENTCQNPTCGAPILQHRDQHGLIIGTQRKYCKRCLNFMTRNRVNSFTSWRDASEDSVTDCPQCLTVYSAEYMKIRSVCEHCTKKNRQAAIRRQTEKKSQERAAARAQGKGA